MALLATSLVFQHMQRFKRHGSRKRIPPKVEP